MSSPTASTSPSPSPPSSSPSSPPARRDQRHAVVRLETALHGPLDHCGGALRPVSLRQYRLERSRAAWREFLCAVREEYPAQPGKCAQFLAIMTRYAAGERTYVACHYL